MLYLIILAFPLLALDNAIRLQPVSSVTNGPVSIRRNFIDGEIPSGKFPAPFSGGSILATWQVDQVQRYQSGAVEHAIISFPWTGSSLASVEFRPNDNPCSAGNQAACDSAALNQAGMLAFNGGTWAAAIKVKANPQGSTTERTFDARAALSASDFEYLLRGPAITMVRVGNVSGTSRSYAFGWKEKRVAVLTAAINSTQTSATVNDASSWAGLSRPFEITMGAENMLVCFVSGNTLYFGNSNGSSSACANVNGRGASGTTAAGLSASSHGTLVFLRDGAPILTSSINNSTTSIPISDASAITTAGVYQIGAEQVRICNKSGNTLTVGVTAWPCSAGSGRAWRGTSIGWSNGAFSWFPGYPVIAVDSLTDRWEDAPADIFKSVQPDAVLAFPAGWAGVSARFRLQVGNWTDRMQDQQFDVTVSINGSNAATKTAIKAASRTQLLFPVYSVTMPRGYWAGSAPPQIEIDHNLEHCIAAGVCVGDPGQKLSQSQVDTFLSSTYTRSATAGDTNFNSPGWTSGNNNKCEADTISHLDSQYWLVYGHRSRKTDDTGARVELGWAPTVAMYRQLSWGLIGTATSRNMEEMNASTAGCQGLMPVYFREHRSALSFCNGGGYPANTADKACTDTTQQAVTTFGLWPSVIAYPYVSPGNQNVVTDPNHKYTPVGIASTNGIVATINGAWSHMPGESFWDAAFSGDYYATRITIDNGGAVTAQANDYAFFTPNLTDSYRPLQRGPFVAQNASDGNRHRAWPMRDMFFGWYLASGVERSLLAWTLRMNAAVMEGQYDFSTGANYTPCPVSNAEDDSPWCFGRRTRGWGGAVGLLWPAEIGFGYNANISGNLNPIRAFGLNGAFMSMYETISYGRIGRKFAAWQPFARAWASRHSLLAQHPAVNPHIQSAYQIADNTCLPEGTDQASCSSQTQSVGRQQGFLSMAAWQAAHTSTVQNLSSPDSAYDPQGRSNILLAANMSVPDADMRTGSYLFTGRRTLEYHRGFYRGLQAHLVAGYIDPTWAMSINATVTPTVQAGDTAAKISASTFYTGCKVAVSASPFASQDDSSDTAMAMIGQRAELIVTGLSAATAYNGRMTCDSSNGVARSYFSFTTTATAGGSVSLPLSFRAPTGTDNVLVEYGSTSGLGSSTTCTIASGTCTATIPANTGRALFIRHTYRDAGNAAIAQSQIYRRIP